MTKTTPEAVKAAHNDALTAHDEAAQAAATATALEQAVATGDETITPDALAQADQQSRFAKLRAKAAQAKADRIAAQAHAEALAALDAAIAAYVGGRAETDADVAFVDAVAKAVRARLAAFEKVNADAAAIMAQARTLGVLETGHTQFERQGRWFSVPWQPRASRLERLAAEAIKSVAR